MAEDSLSWPALTFCDVSYAWSEDATTQVFEGLTLSIAQGGLSWISPSLRIWKNVNLKRSNKRNSPAMEYENTNVFGIVRSLQQTDFIAQLIR